MKGGQCYGWAGYVFGLTNKNMDAEICHWLEGKWEGRRASRKDGRLRVSEVTS